MTVVTGWVLTVPKGESIGWGLAAALVLATQTKSNGVVRYEGDATLWANRYRWCNGEVELVTPEEAT